MTDRCEICSVQFTMINRRHTCRLCRATICDTCSNFMRQNEIKQNYDWCLSYFSQRYPSFITFIMHENQVRLCNHCNSWKDQKRKMKSQWKLLTSELLPLSELSKLMVIDSSYRFMCRTIIHAVRRKQQYALRLNTRLTDYERACCVIPLSHTILRSRWNYLCTGRLQRPVSNTILDTMELLWRLRNLTNNTMDQTKKRGIWGYLWSNRSTQKIKLIYYLCKQFNLESFIPAHLEKQYNQLDSEKAQWLNWVSCKSSDAILPEIPCPIWKEKVDSTSLTMSIFPSATKPKLMRWGRDKRGILWKQESGYVDRMIEYSIAVCSEGLQECGILQNSQIWYDVVPLNRNTVAIQIVPNCVSLSSLVEQKKTILEFVCDNNDGVSVSVIRRRLMESIAFSSAISWFFGFGDRHLDNLMVTKEGHLFHIDFGYCFGREPKMGVPRIRVTESMMKSLGEEYWRQCLSKGQTIMNWLKAHLPTIRMITEFSVGDSKGHLVEHWRRIQEDKSTFEELAMESIGSWTTSLHDFFHSQAQSFRSINSLWTTITNVFVDSSN